MGILLPHEMYDVVYLIGGHHGVEQVHFFMAVTAHCIHAGYAMPVLFYILVYDFLRLGGGNLQCHPLVPVMEGRDGLGGYELEQNGIAGIQPSEHVSEDTEYHTVACKHIFPDRPSCLIGYIECNKVRTACGGISS